MPAGEDRLVVEAVLLAGEARQHVLLHRTVRDGVVRGEPGATVTLVAPGGERIRLRQNPLGQCALRTAPQDGDSLRVEASCYSEWIAVRPGATYELHVETRDGLRLRGRTTVPGEFRLHTPPPQTAECALPPETNLTVAWSPAEGAWSYLSVLEVRGLDEALRERGIKAPAVLELTGLAVSERDTSIVLPREFGIFERGDLDQALLRVLQEGLPAGVRAEVVVAAAERNFVHGARGGGFNPSGRVQISSVVGDGRGVFGALVARRFTVRVGGETALPPCTGGSGPAG